MSMSRVPMAPSQPDVRAVGDSPSRPRAWPEGRDVHVWSIDLAAPHATPTPCLDSRELERARRFVYADDARRYTRAHLALRAILASYLGCDPDSLDFGEQELGKPRLLHGATGRYFNLSHSKDMALLALGGADEVGVDIEAVRDDLPGDDLASAVLCAAELEQLGAWPEGERAQPFVICWTRKEACLKAVGLGLNLEPRSLHVGFDASRLRLRLDSSELDVETLPVRAGYCAAVAAVGGLGGVHCFEFQA